MVSADKFDTRIIRISDIRAEPKFTKIEASNAYMCQKPMLDKSMDHPTLISTIMGMLDEHKPALGPLTIPKALFLMENEEFKNGMKGKSLLVVKGSEMSKKDLLQLNGFFKIDGNFKPVPITDHEKVPPEKTIHCINLGSGSLWLSRVSDIIINNREEQEQNGNADYSLIMYELPKDLYATIVIAGETKQNGGAELNSSESQLLTPSKLKDLKDKRIVRLIRGVNGSRLAGYMGPLEDDTGS
jgi:hypothetical protein